MHYFGTEKFPERTGVRISDHFLKLLKQQIRLKFRSLAAFSRSTGSRKWASTTILNLLKEHRNKKFLFPLDLLLRCCKICAISPSELHQYIVAYGSRKGARIITEPILPVRITPIFDMLYSHHMADGFVVDTGRNRMPYFGYRQFDLLYRLLYLEKIQDVFGTVNFDYVHALNTTELYCPPLLSQFFFEVYRAGKRDFLSERAMLPAQILSKSRDHLLAVLIAFLIDEGHVDGSCLLIRLKNPQLIRQLHDLCTRLGYPTTVCDEKEGYAVLYILSKAIPRFWKDYLEFVRLYPVADLGWKGTRIKEYLERQQRKIRYVHGNREEIVAMLRTKPLTVREIASKIRMTRQGVRYHIDTLLTQKKVGRVGISKFAAYRYAALA
jgi:hypothetical protein